MLSNIGIPGLILILVALLLFFGPSKLPEIGKAFGKGLREFKDATRGIMDDDKGNSADKDAHKTAASIEPIELETTAPPVEMTARGAAGVSGEAGGLADAASAAENASATD